jgi:hypothetical protein
MNNTSISKKYGYLWVTLALFLISIVGHWVFAWFAFVEDQMAHAQSIDVNNFIVVTLRDTLENWQSEFLQLIWQVAGLSILWFVGSPQSKEASDRLEAKIDYLIKNTKGTEGKKLIIQLEKQYPKS